MYALHEITEHIRSRFAYIADEYGISLERITCIYEAHAKMKMVGKLDTLQAMHSGAQAMIRTNEGKTNCRGVAA